MNSLVDLQKNIVEFRDARDWKQFHNPKDLAISLVLEASELLEHVQWRNAEEIEVHLVKNKEDFEDELADTLYYLLLIASDLDIDIAQAMKRKLAKNNEKYPVHKAKGNHKKYTELEKE